ncbi:DLP12 prophage lysozyme [Canicola haemoglobinophilus]|uniref:Lysozyme n=1 Tax=Canicola haemoglobinophilus TaxID=733 RepID=A0AB38HB87_9PAST|nr:lysozyme [Canicola haemoglobinophilus]STO54414.1 DLP12 prophage lysozyme [Canicola haemoglobinophilus]STO68948.1 DLP12 prophage lysozyme [Canicola haemoglobinophilus]
MSRLKTAGKYGIGVCSVVAIIGLMQHQFGNEFRTSEKGLEIIGNAEGCRRDPYICPADVLTVGLGSTEYSGELINPNKRYSDLEIAERWKNDIKIAERCVNQYAKGYYIPQGVFDAATSLTFNVGCGATSKSTMFRKIRKGDYVGACNELSKWVYSSGRKLRGLEIRREKERSLCLKGIR